MRDNLQFSKCLLQCILLTHMKDIGDVIVFQIDDEVSSKIKRRGRGQTRSVSISLAWTDKWKT